MSTYYHGARVKEQLSTLAAPKTNHAGLHVLFGTAPVHLTQNPYQAANELILVHSYEEAVKLLGYSTDFKKYTLCQAMDTYFKEFAVAPVVFCNVLDPAKHVKENAGKEYNVTAGQAKIENEGVLTDTLTVKTAEEVLLKEGEDYLTSFGDDGSLVITMLPAGKGADIQKVTVGCKSIDPSMVTEEDLIGGLDADTEKESGLELVRRVFPKFGKFPGLLLAPGWSQKKNVAAVLGAKCEEINGVFSCECVIDLDTEAAPKYTACEKLKEDYGLTSDKMILLWPKVKIGEKEYFYSAVYGAMTAYTDMKNDSVPSLSPSNKLLGVTAAVTAAGTEINLDTPQANTLNAAGIVTVLNYGGYKSWGNNTAAYPENKEPMQRWICCRRMFSWWANSFIQTCSEKVDNAANYRLIESIVDEQNIRGNSLVQQGKLAGMKMSYNKAENTVEDLLEGRIKVEQRIAPWTPAEDILNVLSFDPTLLKNALGGN